MWLAYQSDKSQFENSTSELWNLHFLLWIQDDTTTGSYENARTCFLFCFIFESRCENKIGCHPGREQTVQEVTQMFIIKIIMTNIY